MATELHNGIGFVSFIPETLRQKAESELGHSGGEPAVQHQSLRNQSVVSILQQVQLHTLEIIG